MCSLVPDSKKYFPLEIAGNLSSDLKTFVMMLKSDPSVFISTYNFEFDRQTGRLSISAPGRINKYSEEVIVPLLEYLPDLDLTGDMEPASGKRQFDDEIVDSIRRINNWYHSMGVSINANSSRSYIVEDGKLKLSPTDNIRLDVTDFTADEKELDVYMSKIGLPPSDLPVEGYEGVNPYYYKGLERDVMKAMVFVNVSIPTDVNRVSYFFRTYMTYLNILSRESTTTFNACIKCAYKAFYLAQLCIDPQLKPFKFSYNGKNFNVVAIRESITIDDILDIPLVCIPSHSSLPELEEILKRSVELPPK